MLKSTEDALRWFLKKRIVEEIFSIEARVSYRRMKAKGADGRDDDNYLESTEKFTLGELNKMRRALEEKVDNS